MTRLTSMVTVLMLLSGCAIGGGSSSSSTASSPATSAGTASPGPSPSLSPTADPSLPAFAIENLRAHAYPGGTISVGAQMARGAGYTKSHMSWPSQGQTMTGTISMPDGPGPFPVVIVNHGHIPTSRYWIGQDSGIFGDPMASHGFISLAPNYPGYSGSGSLDAAYPDVVATAMSVMDLVSSMSSLPQADTGRVAMIGHSNGGGVSLLVSVIDKRVRAYALFAPISSDMADNARKWWTQGANAAIAPKPDQAPELYAHVSPRNYFVASTPPMLFLQGTADQDIPADWTNATIAALQAKGVATAVQWYPNAEHDFGGATLSDSVSRAEAWIRQHIGA